MCAVCVYNFCQFNLHVSVFGHLVVIRMSVLHPPPSSSPPSAVLGVREMKVKN